MKKLLYIGLLLGLVGCTTNLPDPSVGNEQGTLKLSFGVHSTETRAEVAELLEQSTLCIYDADDRLIRKYTPATDMPEEGLMLLAGEYRATVEVGTKTAASFTRNDYYFGETEIEILPRQSIEADIVCKLRNIAVTVKFDATVATLVNGYGATVGALSYTEPESTGWFLTDENLEWSFAGTVTDWDGVIDLAQNGTIDAQAGEHYTLTFFYTKTETGKLELVAKVNKSEEEIEDAFYFSPQPSLKGEGITSPKGYTGGNVTFEVASVQSIKFIRVVLNGMEHTIYDVYGSHDSTVAGINYTPTDAVNGTLTLDEALFASMAGGEQAMQFNITDEAGVVGKTPVRIVVPGMKDFEVESLWHGKGGVAAYVTTPNTTSVQLHYRERKTKENGAFGQWIAVDATPEANFRYTTQIPNLTADRQYEYQLYVDGAPQSDIRTLTTAAGTQIPNGGMEDWEADGSIWYPCKNRGSNQGSSYKGFWATGNGKVSVATVVFTEPKDGHTGKAAYMETKSIVGNTAAGNLFTGYFNGAEMSGQAHVYLGRPFEYNGRPKALRFWYKASVGGGDKGRVFVMLGDMSGPHYLDNMNESSIIQPTWKTIPTGTIHGYADQYFTENVGTWTLMEMPIVYNDEYLDAGAPNYLIISTTSSHDGAHRKGNTGNHLYLDDIEFVY